MPEQFPVRLLQAIFVGSWQLAQSNGSSYALAANHGVNHAY
jgi:hypothetical protein